MSDASSKENISLPIHCIAWNNGKHHESGAGYGLKVPVADRDRYFRSEWKSVILELPVGASSIEVTLNVAKPSFWSASCHELISKGIGQWLRNSGHAPWSPGQPPTVAIEVVSERRFKVVATES